MFKDQSPLGPADNRMLDLLDSAPGVQLASVGGRPIGGRVHAVAVPWLASKLSCSNRIARKHAFRLRSWGLVEMFYARDAGRGEHGQWFVTSDGASVAALRLAGIQETSLRSRTSRVPK